MARTLASPATALIGRPILTCLALIVLASSTLPAHCQTTAAAKRPNIVLIVADNLVRAFGLAGALAMIRYRTRMQDPKDTTMVFFAIIMKRPTIRGRNLLDEILGFKDYLEVAEKDELNLRNPPEKTPELFETYLPFALALGVDQLWAEKFAAVLAAVQQADGATYQPLWYNGSFNTMDLSGTTSQLSSSLNTAITSSVTPPGSSSGGGGGGFSGGGGGGGGGGGW